MSKICRHMDLAYTRTTAKRVLVHLAQISLENIMLEIDCRSYELSFRACSSSRKGVNCDHKREPVKL